MNNPAPKTNIDPTVIVAELLKPASPCDGVIIPEISNNAITSRATRSTRNFSVTKRNAAKIRTAKTIMICRDINSANHR